MTSVRVTARRGATRGVIDPVAELDDVTTGLERLGARIIGDAVGVARDAILSSVAATRGTLSMSGIGATLDAVPGAITAGDDHAEVTLHGEPRHGWRFAAGTAGHRIKTYWPYALPTTYGYFRAVDHPGTPTVDLVTPACDAADDAVDVAVDDLADEVLVTGG